MSGYGAAGRTGERIASLHDAPVFEREGYIRRVLQLFEACRTQLGDEVELIHDAHERVNPTEAVQFAKDLEKFRLFYLEDVLSPEDIAYFRSIRQQCTTALSMGELFNSPHEWIPLVNERLIDFIRIHVSEAGGLSPCRKVAAMCEVMGVRTAWHGPADVSPIGHSANLALDLACYNFGIQEYSGFNAAAQEVFKGCPVMKDGYLYANEAPGWGIEIDEAAAAKHPFDRTNPLNGGWGELRLPDGTLIKQ
jgi:mannonate dehydratase